MMALWAILAAMTLAAVGCVLWPLWRHDNDTGPSRRDENIAIYRERLAELQAERDAGRLDTETFETQRAELDRRLLHEADEDAARAETESGTRPWLVSAAIVVALPLLAGGLYLSGGSWQLAGDDETRLEYLVQRLQARVNEAESDRNAWALLGRARQARSNYAGAAEAYATANALSEAPDPAMLLREGEARMLAADGRIGAKAAELFERAAESAPNNGKALWYAGMAAQQRGRYERAAGYLQRLLELDLPESFRATVERQLEGLDTSG